jgi:hypothetical protein
MSIIQQIREYAAVTLLCCFEPYRIILTDYFAGRGSGAGSINFMVL